MLRSHGVLARNVQSALAARSPGRDRRAGGALADDLRRSNWLPSASRPLDPDDQRRDRQRNMTINDGQVRTAEFSLSNPSPFIGSIRAEPSQGDLIWKPAPQNSHSCFRSTSSGMGAN